MTPGYAKTDGEQRGGQLIQIRMHRSWKSWTGFAVRCLYCVGTLAARTEAMGKFSMVWAHQQFARPCARATLRALLMFVFCIFPVRPLRAQSTNASLTGRITDATKAV